MSDDILIRMSFHFRRDVLVDVTSKRTTTLSNSPRRFIALAETQVQRAKGCEDDCKEEHDPDSDDFKQCKDSCEASAESTPGTSEFQQAEKKLGAEAKVTAGCFRWERSL